MYGLLCKIACAYLRIYVYSTNKQPWGFEFIPHSSLHPPYVNTLNREICLRLNLTGGKKKETVTSQKWCQILHKQHVGMSRSGQQKEIVYLL